MEIFKIKRNDTKPALAATLQYSNGTPVDLTGAGSVIFFMGNTDYSNYASGLCTITGSTAGTVEYRWAGTTDTGSAGTYFGEFQIYWAGSRMTFPADHSLQIQVFEDYK